MQRLRAQKHIVLGTEGESSSLTLSRPSPEDQTLMESTSPDAWCPQQPLAGGPVGEKALCVPCLAAQRTVGTERSKPRLTNAAPRTVSCLRPTCAGMSDFPFPPSGGRPALSPEEGSGGGRMGFLYWQSVGTLTLLFNRHACLRIKGYCKYLTRGPHCDNCSRAQLPTFHP